MAYFYLFISIVTETIATLALKSTHAFTVLIPSIIVILGYGIAFFCLSLTLKDIPIGLVYATWSGLGIILISLGGYLFHNQSLDFYALLGILFIIIGVLCINLLSKSSVH